MDMTKMKAKCPDCENEIMTRNEDNHVCPTCEKTLTIEEAEALFEDGKLIGVLNEDEGEDTTDDTTEKEFGGFSNQMTWAVSVIAENEYPVYKKIKAAFKKDKLDEKFVTKLLTKELDWKNDVLASGDTADIQWSEVNEHLVDAMKDAEKISIDVVSALFAESELTEDQKEEITTIFESAVDLRINDIKLGLLAQNKVILEKAIQDKTEELEEHLSGYVDEVAKTWYEENKIVIENSQKVKFAESFIDGLHDLFEQHYVHVPADRYDIIEGLSDQVNSLEDSVKILNEEKEELTNTINSFKKEKVLQKLSEGLVDTHAEKLATLAETVNYKDDEDFAKQITKLKEAFVNSTSKSTSPKEDDNIVIEEDDQVKNMIKRIADSW